MAFDKVGECVECGDVMHVSKRGLCRACAYQRSDESIQQMQDKQGPIYDRWLIAIKAALEGK